MRGCLVLRAKLRQALDRSVVRLRGLVSLLLVRWRHPLSAVAGAAQPDPVHEHGAPSAALTISIGFARFPFVRAPYATSSPNLVAKVDTRRLPLISSENLGGYRVLIPSIAVEQPKRCRSAGGNPSNRSLRSKDPIPTGRDGAAGLRRCSGRIPGLLCLRSACTSARLCRSLLSFAFHLATPRNHGSENETRPSSLKLAPVAYG
jgi:hypothetical protein